MTTVQKISTPQPIDDFQGWLDAFAQPSVLVELVALAACALLAWALVKGMRRGLRLNDERSIWFGSSDLDGVLFPAVLLCAAYLMRDLMGHFVSVALFRVALPVLVSLLVIRVGVKVLQAAFEQAHWARTLEQTISWVVWLAMVLWVSGLLPVVLNELDQISWKVGASHLTVRNLLEGGLTAGAVLIFTLWLSAGIESRLLRSATGGELSLRKAISNATRALLMFLGLILACSAVGIDLTALSVLGGAVGVGVGFGLQKLAANYVSGFVILAERSMRIGDSVRVDNFEGVITQINARYTVVRSLTGRESIVPNELLITSRVENLSLADARINQSTVVNVGYGSDVELVMRLLLQAALDQPRVLRDPAPAVHLSNFAPDGLEFTVAFWFEDPAVHGQLRSEINLAILAALRSHGVEIPYPQRVVYQR
jgi:small-conductance mechanosensitive channel